MRRTKLMKQVEAKFGPLEKVLPAMINEKGIMGTAEALGLPKATLSYWLLKLGINVRRVALAPGETLLERARKEAEKGS
ncbi:MAG: hypothetical protein L0177_19865 [Chloroflexi bacterium]|nr:hypothetical protein [Chloroflexota bacterium]